MVTKFLVPVHVLVMVQRVTVYVLLMFVTLLPKLLVLGRQWGRIVVLM
jgi:hypothetical protein